MGFVRKRCAHCKGKLADGDRIHDYCIAPYAEAQAEKSERKHAKATKQAVAQDKRETRAKLEKMKTRSEWMKEAQAAFNSWVRARDREAGWPCISSGRPLNWHGNQTDAGHFRSVGSAPQCRFVENNCWAQSKHDNQFLSGNAVEYRKGLIARIGIEAVEVLEADNTPRHYTIDDLKEIKKKYTAKAREIAKRNGW